MPCKHITDTLFLPLKIFVPYSSWEVTFTVLLICCSDVILSGRSHGWKQLVSGCCSGHRDIILYGDYVLHYLRVNVNLCLY